MMDQSQGARAKTLPGSERTTDVLSVVEEVEQCLGNSCLVVLCGAQLGKRIPIGSRLRIGREPVNELRLELGTVSRFHAEIITTPDEICIYDLKSTNGTLVNSERIDGRRVLRSGDQITIGRCILKLIAGDDVEAKYHEEVYRLAITDGLTGAHNRRALMEVLQQESHRAARYGRDLCVLMLDIDHFKDLNDHHGHVAGDEVLRATTRAIEEQLRCNDFFARFGGEEFVILLPETDCDAAAKIAERLRCQIESQAVPFQRTSIAYTVSIGVALFDPDESPTSLIERADAMMYEAKRSGRNIVCWVQDDPTDDSQPL